MQPFCMKLPAAVIFSIAGGLSLIASLVYFIKLCRKLYFDRKHIKEGWRWTVVLIFSQGLTDLVYAVAQFIIWIFYAKKKYIQEDEPINIIAICCVYVILLIISLFAMRYCYHYSRMEKKNIVCDIILYLLLFTLTIAGTVFAAISLIREKSTYLIILQIGSVLCSLLMVLISMYKAQYSTQNVASNKHFYNWMAFLILIVADLLCDLCYNYFADEGYSGTDVLAYICRIADLLMQLMTVANYYFYIEWLKGHKEALEGQEEPLNEI